MNSPTDINRLNGKQVLLGITGGIAAYKSAELVRRLRDQGAEVHVVMTRAATEFVTPLTFQALSGHPVHVDLLDEEAEAGMGHIELARWADVLVIAPASANTIARIAQGRGDDLLTAICLATEAPVAFAPSMNRAMWADAATTANCATLVERGYTQLGPDAGSQACGEVGEGRMLEVADIISGLNGLFDTGSLQGVNVMITAGPTHEAIDPVRFIGNRSSGRMGFEIAAAAREAGARVTLVARPITLQSPEAIERIDVESASEMHEAVMSHIGTQDIFIGTAAVADYRPAEPRTQKIKKQADSLNIELVRNPDILADVAARDDRPFVVGFAAETDEVEHYARQKLENKNLDMIAANRVGVADSGFNSEHNELLVIWPHGEQLIPHARKRSIAVQLVQMIAKEYNSKQVSRRETA